jgi:hypothetical protein
VEAVVHQALGDVDLGDAGGALIGRMSRMHSCATRPFCRCRAPGSARSAGGDVVGVEDGDLRGLLDARAAEHGDVHPGDGRIEAEPKGRRRPRPGRRAGRSISWTAWSAMNGARCALRPIGPMPGPPPPCGMAKVLCRFMWLTSAPMSPGEVRPTWALRLAPSMYTWPPWAWTMAQMSRPLPRTRRASTGR